MKRIILLVALCSSCVSSTTETGTREDSVSSNTYEDFSEVAPFTIKEELRAINVTINGKQKKLSDYLARFYAPDPYTPNAPEDSVNTPSYIITDAKVVEANFFVRERHCERRSILFASRGNFIDQEFYDLLYLTADRSGEVVVTGKETFDGSQGQSSATAWVGEAPLPTDNKCVVLQVTCATEGGDINFHKDEWVEYYIADKRNFRSILKLQLEETNIQDYEVTQNENENSSSETRAVKVLSTSSNGLHDLEVRYISRQDADTLADMEEVYTFDGNTYIKK